MNSRSVLPRRLHHSLLVASAVVACLLSHGPSHATSLSADARRVERVWGQTSLVVTHMRPRFLISGEALAIVLPEERGDDRGCTTVGVVGARTTEFVLELSSSSGDRSKVAEAEEDGEESVVHSTAGALTLVRCGASRRGLGGLTVRMKSPQAALEILVSQGSKPAPSVEQVLPERTAGTVTRTPRPGPPPLVAPLSNRVEAASRSMGESGGQVGEPLELRVDSEGSGRHRMLLERGCHRLVVLPRLRAGGRIRVSDTDLEVRRASSESVVRDRSFATDAVVDVCTGESDLVELRIAGAPSSGTVVLLHGRWSIPQGIPESWEPRARSAVTQALLVRRGPGLAEHPAWEGVGVTGTTVVPVPVAPGACYVVLAGAATGEVKAMQVAVRVGARLSADNGGGGVEAGLVSFCAGGEGLVLVEINAIGSRVAWNAGLWKVGASLLGAEVLP
jgi:hypothetical protein